MVTGRLPIGICTRDTIAAVSHRGGTDMQQPWRKLALVAAVLVGLAAAP
jgi:hypothetical protein